MRSCLCLCAKVHFGAAFYPLNLEHIAVACSSDFPLPNGSILLPARPKHALKYFRSVKTLVVRAPIAVLEVSITTYFGRETYGKTFINKTARGAVSICWSPVKKQMVL